ncbi:hypothetical protein QQM39_25485 [Streptomyces sp. DT2A-34]|uniref:hypothetical protein n=1 Tax=Streptomyces sp. DT2A-34 TaxID=3051182 RepID=UPI00265C42B0|nr:hypothetical protein [Streptomyces sp. DT2A-34]MDO0914062.1 hypothetical protein [Streptomyces sp. DT2A-34]
MKLRHARAVAVSVCVVVALTGARRSHGGGCDDSSSSHSSSSSSGGSTHYDDDDDYDTGSSSGGGAEESQVPAAEDTDDLKIEKCEYDAAQGLVARVRATNSSATTTYSYSFTVTFKDPAGKELHTTSSGILTVDAGATETTDVAVPQSASGGVRCELSDALRMSDSY